jgi:hypothetical protein
MVFAWNTYEIQNVPTETIPSLHYKRVRIKNIKAAVPTHGFFIGLSKDPLLSVTSFFSASITGMENASEY